VALPDAPTVRRHEVPRVPGAFVLTDLLSPREARALLATAITVGCVAYPTLTVKPSNPLTQAPPPPAPYSRYPLTAPHPLFCHVWAI